MLPDDFPPGHCKINWKWGLLASAAITLLSLFPQFHLKLTRGGDYNGAFATLHGDEFLYSAYLNALIDGRPRRNDPFGGRDDHESAPMPESHMSVQFAPPLLIAVFGRTLGASASSAFVVLAAAAGALSGISVFWLLALIIGDSKLAATGALLVLCLGTAAGGQGIAWLIFDPQTQFFGLAFLRRHVPAAALPLFFVLCALTWKALTAAGSRAALSSAALAGGALAVLIFSYFYFWTAAAAWLTLIVAAWFVSRPVARRRGLVVFPIIAACASIALIPYAFLLLRLPKGFDETQVMIQSRLPDLFRAPEALGACTLVILIIAARRKLTDWRSPRFLFAASFALLPFAVFNQQVVTGTVMQPYHYEIFVANYAAMVGLVMSVGVLWPGGARRAAFVLAALSLCWGAAEVALPTLATPHLSVADDEVVPLGLRLRELAGSDGTWDDLRREGRARTSVLSPDVRTLRLLPTWAPQRSLSWACSPYFDSITHEDRKEMLYAHLYLTGVGVDGFRDILHGTPGDGLLNYLARSALFGPERLVPMLSSEYRPISEEEIDKEAGEYEEYSNSFTRERAASQNYSYLITRTGEEPNLSIMDRWFERDAGESVGVFTLYHLKLRP